MLMGQQEAHYPRGEDGWVEIEMDELFNDIGEDGEVGEGWSLDVWSYYPRKTD
uniref:Uncharacterized protein n=1 Tax=Nelumbo nucifera TaxID=4432 RepID=A0A822Z0E0_NELNU|nr:TPA_asm: hypothetical protein HUJ06_008868 [Nelumbo nucifera]